MGKLLCPYCGRESEHEKCDHCKAFIPSEKTKEPESGRTRKKKELRKDGT